MNATLEWLFTILMVGLEVWMTIYLSTAFFRPHLPVKLYTFSKIYFYFVEILWLILWNQVLYEHIIIKYVVNALIFLSWLVIAYRGSVIKHLFYIVFIFSYFNCVDILSISILSSSDGVIEFSLRDPYTYFAIACSTKIIELFGVIFISGIVKKLKVSDNSFRWMEWFKTGLFPFSALIISVIMSRIILTDLKHSEEYAACMFVVLVVDLISINLLNLLDKSQRAIHENAVLRQNLKLETDHIISLQDNYEQQRKQTHDYYNQLATLQGMADKGAPLEDFSKYLGRLLATKPPAVFYINTHRIVVDVVLSQKVPYARDEGIDFQLQLEDLTQFPLPDDALVVILTNLIDNAIEACEKIPVEQERFIQLVMKTEGKKAWLCIENTTSAPVEIYNNFVMTTKSDPLSHGYGLKNISALINQNNGTYILDYREKDHRFCFYSTFPVIG